MANLIDILPEKLRGGLTEAERRLLMSAQEGWTIDLRSGDKEKDDPVKAADWGAERTIRAGVLPWLCTDDAAEFVHAKGILIVGAKIVGSLDFGGLTIPHRMGFIGCALKSITLMDASAQTLIFNGSVIGGFIADRLKMSGGLFMKNVKALGEVRLTDAVIGGTLECDDAEFNNPSGNALHADRLKVKGSVFLRNGFKGFKAAGTVRLLGADIGGDLDCSGAELNNPGGKALFADGITAKGFVLLRKVKAKGEVRLLGADIRGNLECDGAEFNNPSGNALHADGLKVKGGVFLRNGFNAAGKVRLHRADIGGDLACISAEFKNPIGDALNCEGAIIKGALFLRQMKGLEGKLSLMHAKVLALSDDRTGWPEKGKLYIDGFEYGGLPGETTPKSASERLDWLRLQPTKDIQDRDVFYPRPYEQLAKVFRDMGHEADARAVLIAKQEDLREHGKLSRKAKVWNWFLGNTIGHGYETWRAGVFLLALWACGWCFYGWADFARLMPCTKQCVGSTFNSFIYSWDVLLPVINFHQKDYFSPDATNFWGEMVRVYYWIQIALGWVFTTLAVASLTGLVRKGKE